MNGRCSCGAHTESTSGLCSACINRSRVYTSSAEGAMVGHVVPTYDVCPYCPGIGIVVADNIRFVPCLEHDPVHLKAARDAALRDVAIYKRDLSAAYREWERSEKERDAALAQAQEAEQRALREAADALEELLVDMGGTPKEALLAAATWLRARASTPKEEPSQCE